MKRGGVCLVLLVAALLGRTALAADSPVLIAAFSYVPGQSGVFGFGKDLTPITLTIREGDSIVGTNLDPVAHTISANDGSFETGNIFVGQSKAAVGVESLPAGTYGFYCRLHPGLMFGTLVVEPAEPAATE